MTHPTDLSDRSDLVELLADYAEALEGLLGNPAISCVEVLRVLRTRDKIQNTLIKISYISNNNLVKLVDLDLLLKQHSKTICHTENLGQFRQNLDPPESSWWWYLELPLDEPKPEPVSGRFDWVWNVGTVTCLVIATSFITQTARAFSTEGFDFLGTLSTISQGAGLAFVAGGALTGKGQKRVSHILSSIKIPPSFHAEATFGASLLLLGTAYGINQNLDVVGNWYFDRAQRHEDKREWSQAFNGYNRALNFSPDNYKTQIAIGFLHERLGNFDQAIEEYKKGSAYGIPEFLNAQARAMLMGALQENDWQGPIDAAVIREAEGLLGRASSSTADFTQSLSQSRRDKRLYHDITINQAIAKIAGIQFKEGVELGTEAQDSLASSVSQMQSIGSLLQNSQGEESSDLTVASTIGRERRECLYWKSFDLAELLNLPEALGVEYTTLINDENYHCLQFRFDAKLSTTPDSLLLRNSEFLNYSASDDLFEDSRVEIQNGQDFINLLYKYVLGIFGQDDEVQVFLIQNSEAWLNLANKISRLIERDYVSPKNLDDLIIWRLFLNKDGQIFAYFAYDEKSREAANTQPFIAELIEGQVVKEIGEKLEAGQEIEFADFKVVLSPEGKVLHVLPWDLAYTTNAAKCEEGCSNILLNSNVRAAFDRYDPDLKSKAELSALNAVLNANSFSLALDTSRGINYEESAIFKLKVSSDGQIVDYQPVNDVALNELGGEIPVVELKLSEFPDFEKSPYADFKLETKGLLTRISPWAEDK